MRWLWKLVFLTVLCGCDYITKKDPPDNKKQEKQSLANKVRKEASIIIHNKYGLIPIGTGGQMMYQIEKLMLDFTYPKPLTESEGRELIVNAVNEFVDVINREEGIHQHLASHPFSAKNVEIGIFLQDNKGTLVQPESFSLVTEYNGQIRFKGHDPKTGQLCTFHQETFEEAQQIVNQSN